MFFKRKILKKLRKKLKSFKEKSNLKLKTEKNKYTGILKHDIKTPLLAQIQALEFILNKFDLEEEISLLLKDILQSNYFMLDIIKNCLYLENIETKRLELNLEKIDLEKEIKKCLNQVKRAFIDKKQDIILKTDKNINLTADKKIIQKIIYNLLTTSLSYGYINSPIEVLVKENDNSISFMTKNKSIYMTNEKIKSLFEDRKTPVDFNLIGMNLNLNLAKKLINLHNWDIIAKSDENSSTFGFVVKK